ncbi:MAG: hypothetical protein WC291_09045 [Thermodesulfovibrionales bacterium]|jgi:hypothetical protein
MAFDPLLSAEIQTGKPVSRALWQKVKDSLDFLYGNITAAQGGEGIANGSFEIDADSSGVPDSWTRNTYPGGSGAYETTSPAHGAKAYKFVHPGGAGNGGGYLESDYVTMTTHAPLSLFWISWASVAGIKVKVEVEFFTKAKVTISSLTVFESTNNPTSAMLRGACISHKAIPSTACFCKIRLIGGYTDTNVAGTVYFDFVTVGGSRSILSEVTPHEITEQTTTSTSYVDVYSFIESVPRGSLASPYAAPLTGYDVEIKNATLGQKAYARLRIGTTYGTAKEVTYQPYAVVSLDIAPPATGLTTVYVQLKCDSSTAYLRRLESGVTGISKTGIFSIADDLKGYVGV